MSTRGSFILRKNAEDKELYIRCDAYPDCAGREVIELIRATNLGILYDLLFPSDDGEDYSVDLCVNAVSHLTPYGYRLMNNPFIQDSLMCEYAYVIDLDDHKLYFYVGWQNAPQEGNRYGVEPKTGQTGKRYYPCRLVAIFSFAFIRATETDAIIKLMEKYKGTTTSEVEVCEVPAVVLKVESGAGADAPDPAPVSENYDQQILGSLKALLMFDPLGLDIIAAISKLYGIPEEASRGIIERLKI